MKILYMIFAICLFLYADNFENVEIIEMNKPFFVVGEIYQDNEAYIEGVKNSCNTQIVQDFQTENIIAFFQSAKEYDSYQAVAYCFYPCNITGKIKLDSEIWDFELNEGGFAVLKSKNGKRYFGDESRLYECGI
ncbi:hypothetical protein [Helicobacter sp. MIT 05-5294]|uniref:hypothetical protein n=1 Tax=Helicobacter sp. MIT 05-5294 TaxID=1548150 RepID=UPI00051F9ABE|nr:hypothetical protein [Helicobacter sp. MIT 05-5294]TLD85420.1 hypothetical protein LS69_009655 [Helicobacter sp. MIT 05-5294]